MLVGAALTPANGPQGLSALAALPALADDEGDNGDRGEGRDNSKRHGGKGCYNKAGHERGWCRHGDRDDRGNQRHAYTTRINGTVISVNGNFAQLRRDDGRVVTVNENGTPLNVGQHYSLNGCYRNNVFIVGCGGNYTSGNYPGGNYSQVSGTIASVNGNSVTLAALPPVTINASQAIASGRTNGALTPLRHITAYGYYQNNTFYATAIR